MWATSVGLIAYYSGQAAATAIQTYGLYAIVAVIATLLLSWSLVHYGKHRIERKLSRTRSPKLVGLSRSRAPCPSIHLPTRSDRRGAVDRGAAPAPPVADGAAAVSILTRTLEAAGLPAAQRPGLAASRVTRSRGASRRRRAC